MTPSDRPSKTADDEAAIAAGREKHEAPIEVTPVVIEKVAAVVQNATDAAAELVTTGLREAADKVEGREDKVAGKLEASDAEKARLLAIDNSRKFVLAIILGLAAIIVPGVPAIIAAIYGRHTAVEIEKVKEIGEENRKTSQDIHAAVNSNMRQQLFSSVMHLRRIASLTKDPGDQEALEVAEAALAEHDRNQAKTDAKE